MMKVGGNNVFVAGYGMISPLGVGAHQNYERILQGEKAVMEHTRADIDSETIFAALIPDELLSSPSNADFTRVEKMLAGAIREAVQTAGIRPEDPDVLFVFSTTKGNISILEKQETSDVQIRESSLWNSARKVASCFHNPNEPMVVSHACVSGITALLYAKRMLQQGRYNHVVVAGADAIGPFIYSGFKAFLALSGGYCMPFSENRDGINLGEAGAAIILTSDPEYAGTPIRIGAGRITNDANHISGPSRTGDELAHAISEAISASGITAVDIGFISAHGTATPFNDEMEAKAFLSAGVGEVPLFSLKGYFGHTLGAAGLVESIMGMESLLHGEVVASAGYSGKPVIPGIHVTTEPVHTNKKYFLKTASGFGGCNAAVVFSSVQ
jgi:3-oxoacyl-[acyl-carrier-protein] synthase-1